MARFGTLERHRELRVGAEPGTRVDLPVGDAEMAAEAFGVLCSTARLRVMGAITMRLRNCRADVESGVKSMSGFQGFEVGP